MTNIKCQWLHWRDYVQLDTPLNDFILYTSKFYIQINQCSYSNCFVKKHINRTHKEYEICYYSFLQSELFFV